MCGAGQWLPADLDFPEPFGPIRRFRQFIASEDRYAVRPHFDFFESIRIQFRVLETRDGKSAPEHVLERINEYFKNFEIGEGDTFWVVCGATWKRARRRASTGTISESARRAAALILSSPEAQLA